MKTPLTEAVALADSQGVSSATLSSSTSMVVFVKVLSPLKRLKR